MPRPAIPSRKKPIGDHDRYSLVRPTVENFFTRLPCFPAALLADMIRASLKVPNRRTSGARHPPILPANGEGGVGPKTGFSPDYVSISQGRR